MLFLLPQAEKQIGSAETHCVLLKRSQCGGKCLRVKNITDSSLDFHFWWSATLCTNVVESLLDLFKTFRDLLLWKIHMQKKKKVIILTKLQLVWRWEVEMLCLFFLSRHDKEYWRHLQKKTVLEYNVIKRHFT